MRIGIYLAYAPNVVLKKEGLGHYLANLLKGFINSGHTVSIACPEWMLTAMDELIDEFNLNRGKMQFLVSYKRPAAWNIYEYLKEKKAHKKRTKTSWKLYRKLCGSFQSFLSLLISIKSMAVFLLLTIGLLFICLIFSPILVLGAIMYGVMLLVHKFSNKAKNRFNVSTLKRKILSSGFVGRIERFMYEKMLKNAEVDLVRQINRRFKGAVDVWYCPAAFWSGFGEIKGTTILNVPDLVTSEFCYQFAQNAAFVRANDNVKRTIEAGKYFITYSDFVKRTLLEEQFRIPAQQIVSIPHPVNNLIRNIQFDDQLSKKFGINKDYTSEFSRSILNTLFIRTPNMHLYLDRYNFKNVKYIFYSSQVRPHKNIMTLIKAYEYLLRRKYCNIKLILTGDLTKSQTAWDYIVANRLQFDVLTFYNVSEQELASLYRCAQLVVTPTLYEGGFPFTFGEGMSVGTPSVMSDIPQTREVVEPYGLADDMLFDPYDYRAMADRIEYGLNHREELYQKELLLYRKLEKRTADVVASEYIAAFQYFKDMEEERQDA